MFKLTDTQLLVLEKSTIECSDVETLFGDYLDQDLPPTLTSRLEEHIAGCAHCQHEEQVYRDIIKVAREIGQSQPPIPTSVQNNLRDALNKRLGLNLSRVSA